jgi:hypothetical protein
VIEWVDYKVNLCHFAGFVLFPLERFCPELFWEICSGLLASDVFLSLSLNAFESCLPEAVPI